MDWSAAGSFGHAAFRNKSQKRKGGEEGGSCPGAEGRGAALGAPVAVGPVQPRAEGPLTLHLPQGLSGRPTHRDQAKKKEGKTQKEIVGAIHQVK